MKCQECNLENGKRTRIPAANSPKGTMLVCPECLARVQNKAKAKAQRLQGPGKIFATVSGPRINPRNRHMHHRPAEV